MPLVRGIAPKTSRLRFASQFETHFLWEVMPTRTRNRHVSVWLTDAELAHLRKQAAAAGLGIDPFLRSLILGVQLRPRPPDTYAALLRELSAIGNNINQIARAVNARGFATKEDIAAITTAQETIWNIAERL